MKKIILLLLISIGFFSKAFSQSLSLSYDNGNISNGSVVTFNISPDDEPAYARIYVTNNSNNDIPVMVKKYELNLMQGTSNTFCWGQCFSEFTIVSPNPIVIAAGQTNTNGFWGEFSPHGAEGISTIQYTFFNDNNIDDSVSVIINYNSGTAGIKTASIKQRITTVNCNPNPANLFTTINYTLNNQDENAVFILRNLVGSEVYSTKLTGSTGKINLSLADLKEGVYCYTVYSGNNSIVAKKLIIKR